MTPLLDVRTTWSTSNAYGIARPLREETVTVERVYVCMCVEISVFSSEQPSGVLVDFTNLNSAVHSMAVSLPFLFPVCQMTLGGIR